MSRTPEVVKALEISIIAYKELGKNDLAKEAEDVLKPIKKTFKIGFLVRLIYNQNLFFQKSLASHEEHAYNRQVKVEVSALLDQVL